MTDGKTRQKRNGPGGSGCFHAFCYFLGRPARGLCVAEGRPAQTWCTNSRKTLFLRFPCTKSGCLFGARPAQTWCTNPRKTLFLRFPCTKSGCLFGARPAQTWCTNPRKPLLLRSLAPSPGAFSGTGRRRLGARIPAKPCSFVAFAPSPGAFSGTGRRRLGARIPANPCSFVDKHHVFGAKGAAGEPGVVLHSPQILALSSTSTTFLKPEGPEVSRTWCLTPRKPLLLRRQAPRLWGQRRRRRTGRGASLPANPCSFVDGHHVF